MDAGQRRDADLGKSGASFLTDPEQQPGRRQPVGLIALAWALGLAIIGVSAYVFWQLWLAWQTGYEPFWQHVGVASLVLFFLAVAYVLSDLMGRFLLGLRA